MCSDFNVLRTNLRKMKTSEENKRNRMITVAA